MNLRHGQPSPPFRQWGERTKGLFGISGSASVALFRFRQRRALDCPFPYLLAISGHLVLTILQAILEGLTGFHAS